MVAEQKVTVPNAKLIMYAIVDGDKRTPLKIAEEQGFIGCEITQDELKQAVLTCIEDPQNAKIMKKIRSGNARPLQSLVGKVMQALNRRGDPLKIKEMLEKEIEASNKK